jgi:hypothetical protein
LQTHRENSQQVWKYSRHLGKYSESVSNNCKHAVKYFKQTKKFSENVIISKDILKYTKHVEKIINTLGNTQNKLENIINKSGYVLTHWQIL